LGKAATNANAVPGFKATGICPLDGNYIPEFAFSVSDAIQPLHSISRTEWDAGLSMETLRSVILHQSSMPSSTNIPQPSASSSIILPLSCKSSCSSNMSKSSGEMNCLPPLTPIQHSQEEVQTEILIPSTKTIKLWTIKNKEKSYGEVHITSQNTKKMKQKTKSKKNNLNKTVHIPNSCSSDQDDDDCCRKGM
jgi:hypothetical protein